MIALGAVHSDGKKDNDVSADELTGRRLDLEQSLLSAGAAAVEQADDQTAAKGDTLTASEKADVHGAALLELKERSCPVWSTATSAG